MKHISVKYCPNCRHAAYLNMTRCPQCGYHFHDIIASPDENTNSHLLVHHFTGGELREIKPPFCNMFSAWTRLFTRFADFQGTSSRSEFWFAQLWNFIIVGFLFLLIFTAISSSHYFSLIVPNDFNVSFIPISSIHLFWVSMIALVGWLLISFVPFVALLARRLRDVGLSNGWIIALLMGVFLPGLGHLDIITLIVISVMPSMRWHY